MSQDVPDDVKQALTVALTRTNEYAGRLYALGTPEFVALGTGATSAAARNRAPQAMATMQHVVRILDVARYHIYLASFERVRHQRYVDPPNPTGGDAAAYFLFTSFVGHAIAVERHLALALSLRFGYRNHNNTRALGDIGEIRKRLTEEGHADLAEVLRPLQENAKWRWLKGYRDGWEHRDPMRVAGLGLQYSNKRAYWKEEPTTLPSGEPGLALELAITDGDPPGTTVDEMMEKGTYCFNLLAKQVERYIGLLEAGSGG